MNEADRLGLAVARPERSLDGLEADVWAGIATQARARRFATVAVAGQIAVLVLALGTSFTLGQRAWPPAHARPGFGQSWRGQSWRGQSWLGQSWVAMSPASLLLGNRQ